MAGGEIFRQEGKVIRIGGELELDQVNHIITELMHCAVYLVDVGLDQLADCILDEIHGLSIEHILPLVDEILS